MEQQPATDKNTDKEIDLMDLLHQVWAARRRVVKYGLIGALLGIIIGFSIPKTYVTSIKLAPESKVGTSQGGGNMAGLAAMAGINLSQGGGQEGITEKIFPDIVKSTPFLLEFADIRVTLTPKKTGTPGQTISLFEYVTEHQKRAWWKYVMGFPGQAIGWVLSIGGGGERTPLLPTDSVDMFNLPSEYKGFTGALSGMIKVGTDKKSSLLEVAVTMQDPRVSAVVADSLVMKLQKYMTAYRTQKTRQDLVQNIRQNTEAQVKYYEAEDRLVEAVDQNRTISSEALRTRIDRLRNERNLAFSIYQQTAGQVEMSKIKLQEETPIATVVEPAIVPDGAVGPKKMMIFVAFAFLGAFVAVGIVVVRSLLNGDSSVATVAKE